MQLSNSVFVVLRVKLYGDSHVLDNVIDFNDFNIKKSKSAKSEKSRPKSKKKSKKRKVSKNKNK